MSLQERMAAANRAKEGTRQGIGRLRAQMLGFVRPTLIPEMQPDVPGIEEVRKQIADFQHFPGLGTTDLEYVLLQAGYPKDPTTLGRYHDRNVHDKPLIPLLQFPDATQAVVSRLNGQSADRCIARVITRSDDPTAHAALVNYVLTPFTLEQRADPPKTDVEFSIKNSIVQEMAESVMDRTPGTHPLGKEAIIQVFEGVMPGGNLHEAVMAEGSPQRIRELEIIQWNILYRLKKSKDPELQTLASGVTEEELMTIYKRDHSVFS